MNLEKFLNDLVKEYKFKVEGFEEELYKSIKKLIKNFDKKNVKQIYLTGATEKKTNSKSKQTIEILISIKAKDMRSPEEIIESYANYFRYLDFEVQVRQFAICFTYHDVNFELIPSKLKSGTYNYHYLYDTQAKKVTVTNMNILRNDVVNSKNQDEIILLKLWRDKQGLQFPSIYIELVVMAVMKKCDKKGLFSRFIKVLDYLKKDFAIDVYYDPSNTDNIVSDMLSPSEKELIKQCAKKSISLEFLHDVLA